MEQDFNPFDLSRIPPKPTEVAKPTEPQAPKPTVRRISMEPLFHSRITKGLAFILGLVLCFLIGYSATSYTLNKREVAESVKVKKTGTTADTTDATIDAKALEDATQTAPTAQDTPAATPTTPAQTTKTYCGVTGMPEAACTAITSIEKNGIKNSKYVSADTSQLPTGTTTEVDEKTWMQPGPELGNVTFTAKYADKTYKGKAFMQLASGTWKVISYTLDQ